MPLPTSTTWNIADFNESTIGSLLSLGPADLTITPAASPYFSYNADYTVLNAESRDGALALLDFNVAIPAKFTVEFEARFPFMPHNLGDLSRRKVGVTVADDAGRGISIYFASTGLAVARVDDFGSVSALPDTADTTQEIGAEFRTVRIAVDSALGRAYVFISSGGGSLDLRYILPVEQTPPTVVDRFQLFAQGIATEPSGVQLRTFRLASSLVIPNYPPTANAGPDRVAPVGQSVRFDGRASYDVEGAPLTYRWRVVDAPFGSQYAAENSSGSTVDDGDSDGSTNTLYFVPGSLPAWVSAGDIVLIAGLRHEIATFDNVTGIITVTTESIPDNLFSRPFRVIRQSLLVDATTETPYALPDVQGIYRFELIVNDGNSDSEPAEVLANVVGARLPFGVEPDVTPLWRALGDEWRFVEGKEVFQEVWCGVAQILSGKLLEAWQYHYNYSIRDAQRTFQRKWLAYRTLIAEETPDEATLSARYGLLRASHQFEVAPPSAAGTTLVVEYVTGDGALTTQQVTASLTGNTLSQIVADINAALMGTGITAYAYAERREDALFRFDGTGGSTIDDGDGDGYTATFSFPPSSLPAWVSPGDTLIVRGARYTVSVVNNVGGTLVVTAEEIPDNLSGVSFRIYRMLRLGIKSAVRGFRILASTAATALGLPVDTYNYLTGVSGALVTDRTYYAGDGVTLSDYGVSRYDLLVVNNGQSLSIDRVLTDSLDPLPGMRLLTFDAIPADVSPEWAIPSVFVSASVDYEYQGAYPNDLFKGESYDTNINTVVDVVGRVVAQRGKRLAVNLETFLGSMLDLTRYEIRVLGVKRRKGIPLPNDVVSIPRLQDKIPVAQAPTIWKENADYILEPLYRDTTGAPLPYLQFRDATFVDPDIEPPDLLWAELTVFSNDGNVEDLFGRLTGFLRDDATNLPTDFNYVAGVAGLMYAQQRGPSVASVEVGAQILLGQPFAEVAGVFEEIQDDFSPLQGRVLIRDADGNTPTRSEVVRSYYYKKDPLDLSATSGLDINPDTQLPWAVGDQIDQFQSIGAGVDIVDLYNTPTWYIPYVKGGLITEIEKFHYFLVRFNLDLVTLSNLSLLFQFVTQVKPTYTHPLLVGLRAHEEDLDVIDEFDMSLYMHLFDSTCGSGRAYMYDDYRGDGTTWSSFDDGPTYFDALVDCPTDIVELCLNLTWAGGVIEYDSIFFLDTDVIDVSGTMGPPGSTFTPTYDMILPAGAYRVCIYTKDGHIVLPPPPPPP